MDESNEKTDRLEEELFYREFRSALNKLSMPKTGETVKVRIINIIDEGVLVDLGTKSEGLISRDDFGFRGIPPEFVAGMEISVVMCEKDIETGYKLASYSQARQRNAWANLKNSYEKKEVIKGVAVKKIKGGLIVDIGIDAFLPQSHLDMKAIGKVNALLGKELNLMIIKLDERTKDAVVSHKQYTDIEKKANREKVFSEIKVDEIVEGTVTSIVDFGFFVDLGGGVEGLVHINDIVWYRVDKIKDMVRVGDKVKLKVIKIDEKENKISLSLKHLTPHPWENIEQKYIQGSVVKGRVVHITDFGAFVELEKGIEGLLHISELAWNKKVDRPGKIVKEGQELELKVVGVDRKNGKLSLSLKQLQVNPWEEIRNKYPPGSRVKCKVTGIAPFGIFVSLCDGFEGLIHVNDLSWIKNVKNPKEIFKVEQEIEAAVLEIKPEQEKATLSIKHLMENPFVKYKVGAVVKGKVQRVLDFGAFVELEDSIEAFVRASEISAEKNKLPSDFISVGQEIEAKVVRSDKVDKKIEISMRKLEHDREKDLIKKYSKIEQQKLGDLLEEKE